MISDKTYILQVCLIGDETEYLHHGRFCIHIFFGSVLVNCHFNILLTAVGVMHEAGRVCLLYLEHIVGLPLPIMDIIHLSILDYNNLSIFHYLGSHLSYRTLTFNLMIDGWI